jgi:agmatine deiminase
MIRFILPLVFIASFLFNIQGQDLPKWMTPEEAKAWRTYQPEIFTENTTPPPGPVRTMAEWEELQGLVVTWTSYTPIIRQIVAAAQTEATVYIICSDSNSVKTTLTSNGVPLTNLKYYQTAFNSVWVRDYGPWSVYSGLSDTTRIIDWVYNRPRPADDNTPVYVANALNIPIHQTTSEPNRLVATGGNFMVDGHGTAFSSKLVLDENSSKTETQINAIMNSYMGISRYIKMTNLPYDGIHHIDMHMKLLDEETILVGEYPAGISDGPQIEANIQYIQNNFLNCFGRPYKIVRIPMPPAANGTWPSQGGAYRTYTNSVIVNKTVIVPVYGHALDTTALRIYRENMPGYRIVPIDCNSMISAGGAIHCITKEVGVNEPVFISHKKLQPIITGGYTYEVKALINTKSGVSSAQVYWTNDTTSGYTPLPMVQTVGDTFVANIPPQVHGAKVFYYISAASNSGRTVRKPLVAPAGAYSFFVDSPVPVELTSFSASAAGNVISLNWATSSEINNLGFTIYKSYNNSDFVLAGFIEGAGTVTSPKEYIYTETALLAGNYSFRLVQVDYDGSMNDKGTVEIDFSPLPSEYSLLQNYPNPFNPSTVISYQLAEAGKVDLRVYDVLGNEVAVLETGNKEAGKYEVSFDAASLSSGTYFYRLRTGSFTASKKMIIIK